MKKSFLSLISSVLIAFVSILTLFSCSNGANRVEAAPTWAIGDWVVDNKKVFTVHSDGQTVYDIVGLSALKLKWNEPITIDGDTYTAIIRRNENEIFETQLKTTKENSSIPSYLYTKITKTDDENYSYSTFTPLYGLDVEPIYANSSKVVKGTEDEGDIKSGSESEDDAGAYLTFRSQSSFNVASNGGGGEKVWDGEIEYSYDTSTWQAWDGKTISSSENDGEHKLYLRGKGNSHFTKDRNNWVIKGVAVYCDGDIRTLMDYESYESIKSAPGGAFQHMFGNNQSLISAPSLPFEEVGRYCFYFMFEDCTSLTTPPDLPATALANSCYANMFYGCTSLTTPPALPATTLADSCYAYMFEGCTSLISAPALPATNIADSCYVSMFEGCKSLTTPPALPATELYSQCYNSMFRSCSSLTSIPVLPATKLASMCYYRMFCYAISPDYSKTKSAKYKNEFRIGGGGDEVSLEYMFGYYFTPEPDTVYYFATDVVYPDAGEAESEISFKKDKISLLIGSQKQIDVESDIICPPWYFSNYSSIKSWSSKDTSIAKVDDSGIITALAKGTTVITATFTNGKTCECIISVSDGVPDNYLTFKSPSAFSVSFNSEQVDNKSGKVSWDGTIYYSKDAVNWKIWNGEKVISNRLGGVSDFVLYFAGRENTCLSKRGDVSFFKIEGTEVSCSGDIRTLLDHIEYDSIKKAGDNIFEGLFRGNSALISAPELPFEELGENCFKNMFNGCTSLITPPDLPAETLADSCYDHMFYGCTSLKTPPALPAETLADSCYDHMFSDCTSLREPPLLPAEELANSCYRGMFYGCKSLTTPPDLPAKNLASYCYKDMFYHCTSLISAPTLLATTLVDSCYDHMFSDCTSLREPPLLPAEELANSCYKGMFQKCTSLTTPPDLPAKNLASSCYEDMFYRCTSLMSTPTLPAETLAHGCYACMFEDCTSLTSVPALPATTLVNSCYAHMFNGCTALKTVPEQLLPATTVTNSCYSHMFDGCTSLKTPPTLPATTIEVNCYPYMFSGCTSLTSAPVLPATTLKMWCYEGMFSGCTSLKFSEKRSDEYKNEFRIGETTESSEPFDYMFKKTGGDVPETPSVGKVYYCASDVVYIGEPESISFMKDEISLFVDDQLGEQCITREPWYSKPPVIESWSSNDTSVATVDASGKITAIAPGTATITARSKNDKTATCQIIVYEKFLTQNIVENIKPGEKLNIAATERKITWSSSDPSIATVKENGEIEAVSPGTTTIIAQYHIETLSSLIEVPGTSTMIDQDSSDVAAICKITVDPIPVESITLSKTSDTLTIGDTLPLTATISPANATDKSITWTSSAPSVAEVNNSGKITAKSPGTATITAKSSDGSNITATCRITVNPVLVNSITLSKTSATLTVGDTLPLTAKISPANATDKSITWTSSAPSIATVDNTGKITAIKPGSATITAKSSNSKTATCTLTIKAKVIQPTKISLSQTSATLKKGESISLFTTISPSNATDKSITWRSSNTEIASVDSKGNVTAKKSGTAKITATTSNGKTATCSVNVAELKELQKPDTITPKVVSKSLCNFWFIGPELNLKVGESITAYQRFNLLFPAEVDLVCVCESSDSSVADAVSLALVGAIIAKKPGVATIRFKSFTNHKVSMEVECRVTVSYNPD